MESWGGALVKLVDPYLQTFQGLWSLAVGAQIGTLVVGAVLLLFSLEFLRASKGWMKIVGRAASVGSAAFLVAAILYGDFLAGPARAAYTLISERAGAVPPDAGAWTTVGVATVGVLVYVGRKAALSARRGEEPRWQPRRYAGSGAFSASLADLTRLVALDPAGRLQVRSFTRNSKKPVNTVKPMRGMRRA
ncbi:MAG: hypothetical protein GC190_02680 [Alphaproteobacteria bacterium]|nr:hypothetical protein [Alphaproteobacteria bacterium]